MGAHDYDPESRRLAVATMLHCIAEAMAEGKWRTFQFKVRQHRRETRDALTNRLRSAGPTYLQITFSMDVPETSFKADVERRQNEVLEALRIASTEKVEALRLITNECGACGYSGSGFANHICVGDGGP